MVSAIWNIEVSVNQGLICTHLHVYGRVFGTFHFCPHYREVRISGSPCIVVSVHGSTNSYGPVLFT